MIWTKQAEDLVIGLWNTGHSATEIAKRMGDVLTRNAVIGKINRLVDAGDKRIKRTGRAPDSLIDWTDEQLLKLLSFREHHRMSFMAISEELGIGYRSCNDKYREIISELALSERA